MGSPNIANNDISDIPVYGMVYDTLDMFQSEYEIEAYLDYIEFSAKELQDAIGLDIYNIEPRDIDVIDKFANENGYLSFSDFVYEDINQNYDDDKLNINKSLDNLNSSLELLEVYIKGGYHEGIFLFTTSDYFWNGEPQYDAIMDDFELDTIEEAEEKWDEEVSAVNEWLENDAADNGWRPYSGGWTGGFY